MISIITSLFKSDYYLDKFSNNLSIFAKNLLSQNIDFELIVIANNPSKKELAFSDIFKKYPWFKFLSVPRESLYATWNRGVQIAKGEIIGFWNVDDIRSTEAIIEAKALFDTGAQLVISPFLIKRFLKIFSFYLPLPAQKINKQIPEFVPETKKLFLEGMVCGPFFLFSKKLYDRVGPFDEQFRIAGDFDWCIRAAKSTDKIVKAKTIGGIFRVDGGGLSAGANQLLAVENNIVCKRHFIVDKIVELSDPEESKYDPKFLKFGERLVKYSDR